MFLKVKLGVVRALENVERTYLLDSNNKSEKTLQNWSFIGIPLNMAI